MGDKNITLSDGRVWHVDFSKITLREYRSLFDNNVAPEDDDLVYAKALGVAPDDLLDLSLEEATHVKLQVLILARNPLSDPNSVSASTLD